MGAFLKPSWRSELHWQLRLDNKLCTDMGNKLCNFLLMWVWVCGARYFGMKKAFGIPKAFAFTMVETRGIEPLTS